MTQRSGWRPEHAVLFALLTAGADLVLALLLLLGVFPVNRWVGIPVLIGGAVAALAILAYSRKLRREQRPEWRADVRALPWIELRAALRLDDHVARIGEAIAA